MVAGDLSWPLQRAAALYADELAVVAGDRRITYEQLERRVNTLGGALERLDVAPGGRIGYLGVNSRAHLECWLGVPAFGRVLVDLNFRLAVEELAFMADDAEIEVLIVDPAQLSVGRELLARCARLRHLVLDGAADDVIAYEQLLDGAPAVPPGVPGAALATISYTGGTTGRPKGVMLSHGNLLANAQHNIMVTGHRTRDRFLHVCPMFHVAGTSNVFACTWVGARQIVSPRFDAAEFLAVVEREGVTHSALVPTMLGMLLDHQGFGDADLSSLRNLQYAASPISPALQKRVLEHFDCEIAQFYGMTEAAPTVSHLSPEDHRTRPDRLPSMGAPVAGVQVELRDPEGRPLETGQVGELWVRGPNVMLGYWHRPDATQNALVDGWYRTGDLARADRHGYLYMVDRAKDMIITGAENVYCVEVEAALMGHAAVSEAAVFGVPDPRWGEAVHAVVVPHTSSTVTAAELVSHLRERIAGFKVPRAIEVRSEALPKSGAGKVLKNQLREPFWNGHERRIG